MLNIDWTPLVITQLVINKVRFTVRL